MQAVRKPTLSIVALAFLAVASGVAPGVTPGDSDFFLAGHDGHGCYWALSCYDNPLLIRADQDGNIVWQAAIPVLYWFDQGWVRNADRNVKEDALYVSTVFDESKTGGMHRILKFNRTGGLEWDRAIIDADSFQGTFQRVTGIPLSANAVLGGVYAGTGAGVPCAGNKCQLYRIDGNGNIVWTRAFATGVMWVVTDVVTGGAYIVGGPQAQTVSKLDPSGNVLWTVNLAPHAAAQLLANPVDGGVYVGCDEYTHFTARLAPNGNVIWWLTDFPVPWPSGGTAYGRTVQPVTGALYVGGWPNRYGKVGADGIALWNIETLTYNAYADARLDGNGVYISGNFSSAGIEKHNGDGSLVWRKWIGPGSWNGGFYDMPGVYVGAPPAAAATTISTLIQAVQSLSATLPPGTLNSLVTKLQAAQASMQRGQITAACGQLGAAVNEVEALRRSGRLTAAQANMLDTGLTQVRAGVPCRN